MLWICVPVCTVGTVIGGGGGGGCDDGDKDFFAFLRDCYSEKNNTT